MRKSETYRNEIKSYIVRTGMTMTEVVDYLSDEYGWSRSVPNLSGKLKRGSSCGKSGNNFRNGSCCFLCRRFYENRAYQEAKDNGDLF